MRTSRNPKKLSLTELELSLNFLNHFCESSISVSQSFCFFCKEVILKTLSVAAALILLIGQALGQDTTGTAGAPDEAAGREWAFYASAFAYFVPDDQNYVSPIITADYGWLHLEARYNYEDLETGSLFLGWNFSVGDKLWLEATPLLGGVFRKGTGFIAGIAPGYKFTLGFQRFELYSEGEYVFGLEEASEDFFYSWSELSYSLVDWARVGLVGQRSKVYQTELDLQRGLLAGFAYRKVDFTVFLFNLGWTSPTVVVSAGFSF
jgi:hypothetical protein